jgi:hypothetical protein
MAPGTPTPTQTKRPDQALDQLRMSIRGEVLTPEEPGYATVPVPFNAMYPGRPAIVAWRSVVVATRSRASPASTAACYSS